MAISGVQMAFPDERTGEVVVMVDTGVQDAETATAAVSAVLDVPFRVEPVPGGFEQVSVRGGQSLMANGSHWCMASFAARRNSDNKLGLVTAGHCSPSTYTIQDSDGTTKTLTLDSPTMRVNNSTMDLMFLVAPTAVGQFYADTSSPPRTVTATRSRTSTNASNGTPTTKGTTTGSFVCHLGQDFAGSGYFVQSCGEVISTSGSNSSAPPASGNFVVVRNTQSGVGTVRTSGTGTLKCFRGDSGGPWFAGTTAFGVMSACAWSDSAKTIASYAVYTSVDFFTTLGVTIVK